MKLFTRTKFIGGLGILIASATTVAPSSAAAPESTPDTKTTPEQAPVAQQEHEPFSPVALVAEGLAKIPLSDEQRAQAEKLGQKVNVKEQDVRATMPAFRSALADQLRSGKIDARTLRDEIEVMVQARENASPTLRIALKQLHDILDKEQREQLVTVITDQMKSHVDNARKWHDELGKDLGLSMDQRNQIREAMAKAEPRLEKERQDTKAAFEAFKGDDFDMEKITPLDQVGMRTRQRAEAMVEVAKIMTDILTPAQREELALKIDPKSEEMGEGEGEGDSDADADRPGQRDIGKPGEPVVGEQKQGLVVRRGYRYGRVYGWGGYYRPYGVRSIRTGYAYGYPFTVGYGPGIW